MRIVKTSGSKSGKMEQDQQATLDEENVPSVCLLSS